MLLFVDNTVRVKTVLTPGQKWRKKAADGGLVLMEITEVEVVNGTFTGFGHWGSDSESPLPISGSFDPLSSTIGWVISDIRLLDFSLFWQYTNGSRNKKANIVCHKYFHR